MSPVRLRSFAAGIRLAGDTINLALDTYLDPDLA